LRKTIADPGAPAAEAAVALLEWAFGPDPELDNEHAAQDHAPVCVIEYLIAQN
jgi:hypothetical protein